jgi:hypothetical protein
MSGSMGSLVTSWARRASDGADAVSHTMGDVLDDVKSRVDDLVDTAHPRKPDARWRRGGGLLLVIVVVVAGAVVFWKRMLRPSKTGAPGTAPSEGSASDNRAEVPAGSGTDQHDTTASDDAGSPGSAAESVARIGTLSDGRGSSKVGPRASRS